MDAKTGRKRTNGDPQPAFTCLGRPTGLISIEARCSLHDGLNGPVDGSEGLAHALATGDNAGGAERQVKDVGQGGGNVGEAQAIAFTQERPQDGCPWAKGAWRASAGNSAVTNWRQCEQQTVWWRYSVM